MLQDGNHRVRADAIRTLVFAISSVKTINQENADLFSEYLFPTLVRLRLTPFTSRNALLHLVIIDHSRRLLCSIESGQRSLDPS
jgi:hypothetical protein